MPLNVQVLQSGIQKVFEAQLEDTGKIARDLASAYDKYCKVTMAGGIPALLKGTEVKLLEQKLKSALSKTSGDPSKLGRAWGDGIKAYWTTPPAQFTAPPVLGMCLTMPGASAVAPAIAGGLANIQNSAGTAAQIIATAVDTATRTGLVTFTTPPPPAGPPPPAMLM